MAVKQLIERVELDSSAASITFSSIPQDYAHLVVLISARGVTNVKIKFNGSATLPSRLNLFGNGSSVNSISGSDGYAIVTNPTSYTADTFSNAEIYISNYTSSNNKSFSTNSVNENNATTATQMILAGLWSVTDAITSLELSDLSSSASFVAGSTASLYGITAGGDGTVTTS